MSFQPLPHLPTVRRVVTGHTANGTAIFTHDEDLIPVSPVLKQATAKTGIQAGFTLIHQARGYPAQIQGSNDELQVENLRRSVGGGIVCEIVDFPPSPKNGDVYLHRNSSLDYMVILKGSIVAVLENGVEKTLNEGDVMVQKGTLHGWKNVTSEYCRYMVVIVPSTTVEVLGKSLEISKIPGLTD